MAQIIIDERAQQAYQLIKSRLTDGNSLDQFLKYIAAAHIQNLRVKNSRKIPAPTEFYRYRISRWGCTFYYEDQASLGIWVYQITLPGFRQ